MSPPELTGVHATLYLMSMIGHGERGVDSEQLAADARRAQSAAAAFAVAKDLDACDPLLRGRPVPRHRLNQRIADHLGVPADGSLTLKLGVIESIGLLGPSPAGEPLCARYRRREAVAA
jgi:hypothetical protein